MADLYEIERYCNQLLDSSSYEDYCPNGLQVDAGTRQIERVVTGVTACQELIDRAISWRADLLLVHHGYFWRNDPLPLTGHMGQRVRSLMQNGISLIAYHLPLDAHPEIGNNRQFGQLLQLTGAGAIDGSGGLLWWTKLPLPLTVQQLTDRISLALNREPLCIDVGDRPISRICWCTGAAQSYIQKAASAQMDAFISGEVSEQTVHLARELGIHYFAAGHHATERYGIRALGELLSDRFELKHCFIEVENPV